ncbi:hypothetical protein RhiirA5_415132 [Rhizophagus irregularis]|uniref:Protein kinase domain-containing protein n=1 Tax=Rhizophagus irregularis TaxID=588596 RepID=A0A2N0PSN7_9GLOM|nr:hypothetical protein RhiirA5_415132 [Rhizophagus irregularis]
MSKLKFGKSKSSIIDLKWIPYNKFKNIEYFNKGGFGTIYKATCNGLKYNRDEIIFKCHKNLNGNEFLKEIHEENLIQCDFHDVPPFNNRAHDIQLSLSICKGEFPEIIEDTPQCYIDLMKNVGMNIHQKDHLLKKY